MNASLMSKAYEKLVVPTFPTSGEMTNWMIALGLSCVCWGFSDEMEIDWLAECSSTTFEEFNQSGWASRSPPLPFDTLDRWRKLDFALAKALRGIIKQSKESLTEDVILKTRECAQSKSILKGRQIVWMMLDYFKANRTLQEQYKYQDIEPLKWMGDEKLPQFFTKWTVITTGMVVPLDNRILCHIFLERIRPSKKLASDVHEFDRMRDDDTYKNLKWLTDSIDRLLQRERMLSARALQTKRIQSGASLTTEQSNANSNAAPAQDKDKGKGKGKAKGKGRGKGKGKG